jgi:hypothetical protein
MKFPIRWHIQCLENMRLNYAKKAVQHRLEAESLARNREEILEREAQIQRAQTEKLDAFDSEKFNKKRK